ncbi:2-succinyl-5-enolpyruvyl-6-hydroxy-3-cyclohexene-1-carboxylic-acid synthase [Microbacterium marinilacus]|uniref:2-succinyl-5-enolpyruvyl-6-hydroxy-3-cyclohexene-1-carboxylate synthase n=1 Tax=Microbacterium marinilacus TaxID=415209 RepID=A0ABP7BC21_9MICO|nr:2-succinyl-5-enolpyruvyl-6-hydroxy-3-cyclohexene-1-carboxylic-acid synthase [Microbacterium marinilacus]MBY0686966.1 2-succinyl-5-enolpyruvyl-6-hydroxy-3-cyclohexene-1-carboxylic-acid synthase [Microbacterium marinilacus]
MTVDDGALASPASDAAAALLDELVSAGVRHVVVSPGSRSQALALAAAALERAGRIRLHVRIDERVAGFTALGIGRETRVPAVVICTSGTAVANLMPAALEARHAGVPLLLLTADRPPELRGIGANQTTSQPGLFRDVLFAEDLPTPEGADGETDRVRAVAAEAFARVALGPVQGVAHLNLPYREPLAGSLPGWLAAGEIRVGAPAPVPAAGDPLVLTQGMRTVVVAGADAGPEAEELAHLGGWPLIAEIVSGSRFGRHVVQGYRTLLRDSRLGGRIERAVVLGHPTLSREVTALLSRDDVEVIAVAGPGERLDLNHATVHADALSIAAGDPDREWLGAWMRASAAHAVDLDAPAPDLAGLSSNDPRTRSQAVGAELAAVRRPLDREQLVAAVWAATWPHDRLVFGSSRLVRVADAVLPGKRVPVHANRGLAGIDGTIATATGIALASQAEGRPGVTRVLLGDLAFLHDAGALLLPDSEDAARVQIVVGNDGGGTIFDGLEVARVASAEDMTRVQFTPQTADLASLARAYGWEHTRVTTRSALDQALVTPGARRVIEVPLPR